MKRLTFQISANVNTGKYENVKVDVGVEQDFPDDEDLDAAYQKIKVFCVKKLNTAIENTIPKVKAQIEKLKEEEDDDDE